MTSNVCECGCLEQFHYHYFNAKRNKINSKDTSCVSCNNCQKFKPVQSQDEASFNNNGLITSPDTKTPQNNTFIEGDVLKGDVHNSKLITGENTLSDERMKLYNYLIGYGLPPYTTEQIIKLVESQDKLFIQKIKEEIGTDYRISVFASKEIFDKIDKLAGKRLIE